MIRYYLLSFFGACKSTILITKFELSASIQKKVIVFGNTSIDTIVIVLFSKSKTICYVGLQVHILLFAINVKKQSSNVRKAINKPFIEVYKTKGYL